MRLTPIPMHAREAVCELLRLCVQYKEYIPPNYQELAARVVSAADLGRGSLVETDHAVYMLAWRNPVWHERMSQPQLKEIIEKAGEVRMLLTRRQGTQ